MAFKIENRKCVLCDKVAITTAVQIPVCKEHYDEYAREAKKYLPYNQRTFLHKLEDAHDQSIR